MEPKKISFGFMKTKKQDKPVVTEKKEYIECVEEKSIKVVGGEDVKEEAPLIIPMKPNTLITAERLKEIAEQVENFEEPVTKKDSDHDVKKEKPPENETLDQMAARELLQEAKKEILAETPKLVVVPINSKPIMDGQVESTLDDYDSIPIQDFGMAMLRGMGWTPGKQSTYKQPPLRPKGLGLGADKIIADKKKNTNSKVVEEEIAIVKNSYIKVTSGKHSGFYGKVVSLDEDNGRIMVDLTIKKETVSLNEFMVEGVTKSEFDKQSKVINSESYEEYKKNENISNKPRKQSGTRKTDEKKESKRFNSREEENRKLEEYNSNGRSRSKERRYRKDSSSSEEKRSKHRKKQRKRYSSNDSISSDSSERQSVSRKRNSSNDSSTSNHNRKHKSSKSKNSKERRDIDKKRKGKKKKRDRDRSPNYKKHRK